jgi:alkanesulfonate monooxygenase SsuD/methylene tetrahydromethanopterin reductase-like flavin-dependent oxidoreductase (luciferase family)
MLISYFTEQPYSALSQADAWDLHPFDHPARRPGDNVLIHSNRFFDPVAASRLYAERIREYELAEEVGFDGVMVNEHHNAPFCMQARITVMSSVVAARTKRVKIVQLGNPLPTWDNPVQLAEETAMIDMISNGRLVAGIVRAGGAEQLANNVNPAFNRERFHEAHDLLIKAWTVPGPWRWEGEHYQQRIVNPWAVPLQKPHPPVWVPGITSKETIEFAARHAYPFVCLNTTMEDTKRIWGLYDKVAAETGFTAGPQHRGYLVRCIVAETEEKALRNAREHLWMQGEFAGFGRPTWIAPTGYSSYEARTGRAAIDAAGRSLEGQIERGTMVVGTPEQVIARLRWWLEETRPGLLMLWPNDGRLDHESSLEAIRLMGEAVLPSVRDIARELGLRDQFELAAGSAS